MPTIADQSEVTSGTAGDKFLLQQGANYKYIKHENLIPYERVKRLQLTSGGAGGNEYTGTNTNQIASFTVMENIVLLLTFNAVPSGSSDVTANIDALGAKYVVYQDGVGNLKKINKNHIKTGVIYPASCITVSGTIYIMLLSVPVEDLRFLKYGTLTSAQILALFTTAIDGIDAPGSGYTIVPDEVTAKFKFNTTAYTKNNAGAHLIFCPTGGDSHFKFTATSYENTSAKIRKAINLCDSSGADLELLENTKWVWKILIGNPTLGDSDIDYWVSYRIIKTT